MLISLQIHDFAIVDHIDVEFGPGMTVLTGETGAGKSILIDALGLVLGDRGSSRLVRSGAKRAEFSAEFDVRAVPPARDWLEAQSLDDDNRCLLRRVINADGRSRAFVNGNAVPVQQLKTLGEMLIDIHGQHFHQSLGHKSVQRHLLDHFAGLVARRDKTASDYVHWSSLLARLEELQAADADRESRLDLLAFQLQELETLGVAPGEYAELQGERQILANSSRLAEGTTAALGALTDREGGNAIGLLAEAARSLADLVEIDDKLVPASELVDSAMIQLGEACDELRRYVDTLDMDPRRQDLVEERLDAIQTIARKHRVSPEEIPEHVRQLQSSHDELSRAEARGRELEQDAAAAEIRFRESAAELSRRRIRAATDFAAAVREAMAGLGMPGGVFEVAVTQRAAPHASGMARIASGGELSRMSLAVQVIASGGSAIPTMVFDEVDSGVGGGVAEMVGRRLAELSSDRQVLCVTHLAQVASLADHHLRINKVTDGKSTRTGVKELDPDERVDELARMIGGVEITDKTREHAAEMLAGVPEKRA